MKGFEQKLVRFMEGSSKRFVIPVYQRNYDWKIEQCAQLYNDLIRTYKDDRKTHFLEVLFLYRMKWAGRKNI